MGMEEVINACINLYSFDWPDTRSLLLFYKCWCWFWRAVFCQFSVSMFLWTDNGKCSSLRTWNLTRKL